MSARLGNVERRRTHPTWAPSPHAPSPCADPHCWQALTAFECASGCLTWSVIVQRVQGASVGPGGSKGFELPSEPPCQPLVLYVEGEIVINFSTGSS
jgi:hypothetical protein